MTVNASDSVTRVKYSGLDFATIEDELLTRLQVKFATSYNDFAISSLGIMLIDIFSYGLDTMAFYLDRRASDVYMTTARTRKSVARLARQLGYKMSPATAASVDVTLTPKVASPFSVTLPIGFQLKSPDGSIWEAGESYTWPVASVSPKVITFSQTQSFQSNFTSDGTMNQVFQISNIPPNEFLIGPGSDGVSQVIVIINGDTWTESELLTFGSTNQVEIGYHDSPPTLRFGDNIAGNIPPSGATVTLSYKTSRGVQGRVTSAQALTVVRPLVSNFVNIDITVTITEGSRGGFDPETIEKAKANAPQFFRARGVNITKSDYNIRAGSFVDSVFGAIAVASAVTVRGASSDAFLQSLVADINTNALEFVSLVDANVATVSANMDSINADVAAAKSASDDLSTDLATISSTTSSSITSISDVQLAAGMVNTFLGQINTNVSTLTSTIVGVPSAGSDQLTTGTRSVINALLAAVQSASINAGTQATTVSTSLNSINTGLSTVKTNTTTAQTDQVTIAALLDGISTEATAAKATVASLQTQILATTNSISTLGQEILDHVDSFLSSDCQSNLVEVPILTYDSDGFYAAPTIALVKSLQNYLDQNKEVTQVIKVFSAHDLLIEADISINVGVLPGYLESKIRSQVNDAIIPILKRRAFGKTLKLSELYWVLDSKNSNIAGVDFVEVVITAPLIKLDGNGNLVVASNEVVTKGTITITSEVVKIN